MFYQSYQYCLHLILNISLTKSNHQFYFEKKTHPKMNFLVVEAHIVIYYGNNGNFNLY